MVAEDTLGGEITAAVIARFAASTPPDYLQISTDLMNDTARSTGIGVAWAKEGKPCAPDTPAFGIAPGFDCPGAPVAGYSV